MPPRYLIGPLSGEQARAWLGPRRQGCCRAFNSVGSVDLAVGLDDTWESVCRRLPLDWRPDFLALNLPYTTVPPCLWSAPVPLVGLAGDWNLLWHHYRHVLPRCELVLTDTVGTEVMRRAGWDHVRAANLYGPTPAFLQAAQDGASRDIDILFVGNLHPAVQRERLPWLGRLARLGARWRVVLTTGVFGDDYRALLARARVVFNRSIRSECNQRVFEAAGAGALLFQEAGNREVGDYLRPGQECVCYTDDDLEALLEHYLTHEDERRALAEAARVRVQEFTFEALWASALTRIEEELPRLQERARQRPPLGPAEGLLARTWQALSASDTGDPALTHDLAAALGGPAGSLPESHGRLEACPRVAPSLHNALGLAVTLAGHHNGRSTAPLAERAAHHFQRAVAGDPQHAVATLNLVEALVGIGQKQLAVQGARRLLAQLDRGEELPPETLDAPHFPPAFDHFRVEWERAAWENSGRPAAEAEAKRTLLRWRLHTLLADLTGDLVHYHEAALARPDLPPTRAALGCALGRAGRSAEAAAHLRQAVAANPFDRAAARALYQALTDGGDVEAAYRLARDRRLLARAAPQVIPEEEWFVNARPVGDELASIPRSPQQPGANAPGSPGGAQGAAPGRLRPRVSLCLIVKNEEANLPDCLGSAADLVDEIVVVDTGSTDRTKEVAARFGARIFDFAWCDSFAAARNEGLRHAAGEWIFWLDADDRLDQDNRRKLRALFAGLNGDNAAYSMKCLCLPDAATGTATLVDHVRLFRNLPAVRWEYRVHEQILPAVRRAGGEVRWSPVVVHHAGYQDPTKRRHKLERDLRLLHLDDADRPDDPFTLFNLGSVYHELGKYAEALPLLRRSLERSHPGDSIVRKLFALIVQCHRGLGSQADAMAACREGLRICPDDTELLFVEALLRRDQGDLAGAANSLARLLEARPPAHFASVDAGLRGYKARHNLAVIYLQQGRHAEAAEQWRQAVAERPDFLPAWLGLGEIYLDQHDWEALEAAAKKAEELSRGVLEPALLRARARLGCRDYPGARALLGEVIAVHPQALAPRVLLTHALLQEGTDLAAAENALRDVLRLDPQHAEARHNLALLLRQCGQVSGTRLATI